MTLTSLSFIRATVVLLISAALCIHLPQRLVVLQSESRQRSRNRAEIVAEDAVPAEGHGPLPGRLQQCRGAAVTAMLAQRETRAMPQRCKEEAMHSHHGGRAGQEGEDLRPGKDHVGLEEEAPIARQKLRAKQTQCA